LSNTDKGAVGLIPALNLANLTLSNSVKPQEKTPVERKDIEVEYDLMNNLGFNLCIVPQSLVIRWSCISGLREIIRKRSL